MTEKELKHLSRRELLEMLVFTTRKNEQLEKKINELEKEIDDRENAVISVGSFAKVGLAFQKAYQNAFDMSEVFIRELAEQKKKADEESELIIREAKNEAENIIKEAKSKTVIDGENKKSKRSSEKTSNKKQQSEKDNDKT